MDFLIYQGFLYKKTMKNLSPNYLKKLISVSSAIFILSSIIFATILKDFYLHIIPITFLFITLSSAFFHLKVISAKNKSSIQFNAAFLGAMGIKLLLNIVFIVTYLILYKENAIIFLSYFLALYFIYLVFDVKAILPELKTEKK